MDTKKPELLAPAGSTETFYTAVESGADAVYLGLDAFNARLRAKNFSAHDLCELVPYAHERNVKVYVTINTLIKQAEIKSVLHQLYQLEQLGVDAVIVADIGLMKLISDHFPNLRIHGSTQAVVHNSSGAEFLKTLGVKRVVLARELSLDEIRETVKKSPIETEVFVHGALCYSISGQCLASSYLGGASGNRGKCTQVCRRKFKSSSAHGYFFSPYDLQAISVIDKLAEAGVSSFKIEGRMKGIEYVRTVVQAYRRAIDFPGQAVSAARELSFDFGREKTMFWLNGSKGTQPIDPDRPSGIGMLVGTITECNGKSFTISAKQTFSDGDRLRIQPADGFDGMICKVTKSNLYGDKAELSFNTPIKCNVGDYVFLIGKADAPTAEIGAGIENAADITGNVCTACTVCNADITGCVCNPYKVNIANTINAASAQPAIKLKTNFPSAVKIANSLTPAPNANTSVSTDSLKPKLWFKVDSTEWLDAVNASPCRHLIFDADIEELKRLLNDSEAVKTWRSRMYIALPVFIEENKLKSWRETIESCMSAGLHSFAISNVSHFALVKGAKQITADAMFGCMNRFTQKELASCGVNNFVFSYEDEYLNIRDAAAPAGIVPAYGRPPLFISRMAPAMVNTGTTVVDTHDNKFFTTLKNGLYYTLPQTPICLFAKREKLLNCGIENFLIDLSFHEPDYGIVSKLVTGFKDGVRIRNSTIFNFKAGLH